MFLRNESKRMESWKPALPGTRGTVECELSMSLLWMEQQPMQRRRRKAPWVLWTERRALVEGSNG